MNFRRPFADSEHALPALLIVMTTALCFWNSLPGAFIQDDVLAVVNRGEVGSLVALPKLFVQPYWGPQYAHVGTYRPLTSASFALNHAVGGLDPFGYHLVNLLLHAVNAFLVYLAARLGTGRAVLAVAAGVLFAAHPVHSEAVNQCVGRAELLSSCFSLLAWIAHVRRGENQVFPAWPLAAFFLALLSKESAIVLIGVLALTDLCRDPDGFRADFGRKARGYLGYVVVAGLYVAIRFAVLGRLGVSLDQMMFRDAPYSTRLFTMAKGFLAYFRLLTWPSTLCTDYDFSVIAKESAPTPAVVLALAVVVGVAALGVLLLKRERLSAFAILFFFVTISIVSNLLVSTGILIAERVLYFPSISVCLLAGAGLHWVFQRGNVGRAAAVGLLAVLTGLSAVRNVTRNDDWKSPDAWVHALVRSAPRNPKGLMALAETRYSAGRFDEAETLFKQAVSVAPDKATTHASLAGFYIRRNRFSEAEAEARQALAIVPDFAPGLLAQARIRAHRNEFSEAVLLFRRAMEQTPPDAGVHQELGVVLFQAQRYDDASEEFRAALGLKPEFAEAHANLALTLRRLGRPDEALPHLLEVVRLEPNNPAAWHEYGAALLNQGNAAEAVIHIQKAVALKPDFAEAHNTLGIAHARMERFDDARREFETALRINPGYENAARNLERLNNTTKDRESK